jgi:hypothetical protein
MFKNLFVAKCGCGEVSVHTEVIPTLAGDVRIHRCKECIRKKELAREEEEKRRAEIRKRELAEEQKQKRYEYLKREVELFELEKKAKELGIGQEQ